MLKYLALAPFLFFISIAEAKKPVNTEFVMGSGFLRSMSINGTRKIRLVGWPLLFSPSLSTFS